MLDRGSVVLSLISFSLGFPLWGTTLVKFIEVKWLKGLLLDCPALRTLFEVKTRVKHVTRPENMSVGIVGNS